MKINKPTLTWFKENSTSSKDPQKYVDGQNIRDFLINLIGEVSRLEGVNLIVNNGKELSEKALFIQAPNQKGKIVDVAFNAWRGIDKAFEGTDLFIKFSVNLKNKNGQNVIELAQHIGEVGLPDMIRTDVLRLTFENKKLVDLIIQHDVRGISKK